MVACTSVQDRFISVSSLPGSQVLRARFDGFRTQCGMLLEVVAKGRAAWLPGPVNLAEQSLISGRSGEGTHQ